MYPNQQRSQKTHYERLMQAINSTRPSDAPKYLSNCIKFLKNKIFSSIQTSRFLEICLIAKLRPDAFDNSEVHDSIFENESFPPGLITTIFISLGRAHELMQRRLPAIMATLLYRDIITDREFCDYPLAKRYIALVVNLYFFPPERLDPTVLKYQTSILPPNAREDPQTIPQLSDAIKRNIDELFQHKEKISKAFPVMLTFFPMTFITKKFLECFPIIVSDYSDKVNVFFEAVVNYMKTCNTQNNDCQEFLKAFSALNVGAFEAEHQRALNEIRFAKPDFGIYTVNIDGLSAVEIIQKIFDENDRSYIEVFNKVESIKKKHVPFLTLTSLVMRLIMECQKKFNNRSLQTINLNKSMKIIQLIIDYSAKDYSSQLFKIFAKIIGEISSLVLEVTATKPDDENLKKIENIFTNILVPKDFEDTGILVNEVTASNLLELGLNHTKLYSFDALHKCLYYASVYQVKHSIPVIKPALINKNDQKSLDNIVSSLGKLLGIAVPKLQGMGTLFSFEFALVSPDYIGRKVWKKEFTKYLISSLGDSKDTHFIPLDIKDLETMEHFDQWITNFTKLMYVDATLTLQLEPYVNDIIDVINPSPPQRWFLSLKYMNVVNISVGLKVMFLRFVGVSEFITTQQFFPSEELTYAIQYIKARPSSERTKDDISLSIAQYLDHDDPHVRKAAFVVISLISNDIAGQMVFKLPMNMRSFIIVGNAIIKELDMIMIQEYKKFLESSFEGKKPLALFKSRCPLKYHEICGDDNERTIDPFSIPDMNCPFYPINNFSSKKMPESSNFEMMPKQYELTHDLKSSMELPAIEDEQDEEVGDGKEEKSDVQEESKNAVSDAIYRHLSVLEIAPHNDLTRFFALASLKRLIIKYPEAFVELMTPMLPILETYFQTQHSLFREQWDFFEYFLSIFALRKRLIRQYTDAEESIINERILPLIKNVFMPGGEYDFLEELRKYVIEESSNISSYLVPKETNIYSIYSKSSEVNIVPQLQFTIIFEDPDQTDERLINFAFTKPNGVTISDQFVHDAVIPMIMSSSSETVSRFFEVCGRTLDVDKLRMTVTSLLVEMKTSLQCE